MLTFQDLILSLQGYWAGQGCVIQQPYDCEKGAGTFNPATFLRVLGPEPGMLPMWNLPAGRLTGATARIPTACSTITSSRLS